MSGSYDASRAHSETSNLGKRDIDPIPRTFHANLMQDSLDEGPLLALHLYSFLFLREFTNIAIIGKKLADSLPKLNWNQD